MFYANVYQFAADVTKCQLENEMYPMAQWIVINLICYQIIVYSVQLTAICYSESFRRHDITIIR